MFKIMNKIEETVFGRKQKEVSSLLDINEPHHNGIYLTALSKKDSDELLTFSARIAKLEKKTEALELMMKSNQP